MGQHSGFGGSSGLKTRTQWREASRRHQQSNTKALCQPLPPPPPPHSPLLTAAQHPRHGLTDVRSLQRFPAAISAPKRGPCGCRSGAEGPKTSERIIRRGRGRGGGCTRYPPRGYRGDKGRGDLQRGAAPNSRRHAHGAGQSNRGPAPLLDPSKGTLNAVQNLATTEKKTVQPPTPRSGDDCRLRPNRFCPALQPLYNRHHGL